MVKQFQAFYSYEGNTANGQYSVDHTSNLYIISPSGEVTNIIPYGLPPEPVTNAIETANSLVSIEPENQYWQVELAVIRNNLISVLLLQGDTSRADQLLEQGRSVIDAELSDRPDDIDWLALEFGQEVYHLHMHLLGARRLGAMLART